jgi:hypothetical protein
MENVTALSSAQQAAEGIQATPKKGTKLHMDLTINVPTIVTLFLLIATTTGAGFKTYGDMHYQIEDNTKAIAAVAGRVGALESGIIQTREAIDSKNATLRTDITGQLSEIKGDVKTLLLADAKRQGQTNPQLKQWSR